MFICSSSVFVYFLEFYKDFTVHEEIFTVLLFSFYFFLSIIILLYCTGKNSSTMSNRSEDSRADTDSLALFSNLMGKQSVV